MLAGLVVVVGGAIALVARSVASDGREAAPTPAPATAGPSPAATEGSRPEGTEGSRSAGTLAGDQALSEELDEAVAATGPATDTTGSVLAANGRSPVAGAPPLVAGRVVDWAESQIEVAAPLASLAGSTELVVVSNDRLLHRVEFPSGRVRSVDLADRGADASFEVGPDAIVVYGGSGLTVVRDDRPVEEVAVPDGVVLVQSWPGTGSFIVTTAALSDSVPAQAWVLDADSNLQRLGDGPFSTAILSSFRNTFLPSGELLVGRPGGVYALRPDAAPRRVSTGDLVGGGTTHYAVVECDDTLRCEHSLVDAVDGSRRVAPLDPVGTSGWDPSTRISPGGRYVVFRDYFRGTGVRQVLDTSAGTAFDIGPVSSIFDPDTWAADGSGLFLVDGGVEFQVAATGSVASLDGFGDVASIPTRPPT